MVVASPAWNLYSKTASHVDVEDLCVIKSPENIFFLNKMIQSLSGTSNVELKCDFFGFGNHLKLGMFYVGF